MRDPGRLAVLAFRGAVVAIGIFALGLWLNTVTDPPVAARGDGLAGLWGLVTVVALIASGIGLLVSLAAGVMAAVAGRRPPG